VHEAAASGHPAPAAITITISDMDTTAKIIDNSMSVVMLHQPSKERKEIASMVRMRTSYATFLLFLPPVRTSMMPFPGNE
jgi:hypothetical protein